MRALNRPVDLEMETVTTVSTVSAPPSGRWQVHRGGASSSCADVQARVVTARTAELQPGTVPSVSTAMGGKQPAKGST
ncbi:hypothetical protein GCM10028790_16920 [Micromonospora taraxaci]